MSQNKILMKLSDLKENLQHLFGKKKTLIYKINENEVDQYQDDLPLTINRDPGPGITFYTTENSEFSRGLARETPKGIDRFDEQCIQYLEFKQFKISVFWAFVSKALIMMTSPIAPEQVVGTIEVTP